MANVVPASSETAPTPRVNWGASAIPYVICGLATFATALVGSQFGPGEWYASLTKPPLNPPNWIFGPVWTTLYCLMAIAGGLVWSQAGWRNCRPAMELFFAQLFVNGLWSYLFFGLHSPAWALVDIVLLWVLIGLTIAAFFRHSRVAAGLLIPYWMWVSFATYLNFMLWRLN